MDFKWKLGIVVAVTSIVTALFVWWAWLTFPYGYVVVVMVLVVVVGGFLLDAHVSGRPHDTEDDKTSKWLLPAGSGRLDSLATDDR